MEWGAILKKRKTEKSQAGQEGMEGVGTRAAIAKDVGMLEVRMAKTGGRREGEEDIVSQMGKSKERKHKPQNR